MPEELRGPEWILADEPMLDQMEEWVMNAVDQEDFDRRLEWLRKNFYQNPEIMSLLAPIWVTSTNLSNPASTSRPRDSKTPDAGSS